MVVQKKGSSTRSYNHTRAEERHEWKNTGALTSIDISISGTQRYNISASTPLLPLPLFSEYSSWNNYWDRYLQAMYVPDPWSLAGWNSNWLDCRTHHWAIYKCAEKESVLLKRKRSSERSGYSEISCRVVIETWGSWDSRWCAEKKKKNRIRFTFQLRKATKEVERKRAGKKVSLHGLWVC